MSRESSFSILFFWSFESAIATTNYSLSGTEHSIVATVSFNMLTVRAISDRGHEESTCAFRFISTLLYRADRLFMCAPILA